MILFAWVLINKKDPKSFLRYLSYVFLSTRCFSTTKKQIYYSLTLINFSAVKPHIRNKKNYYVKQDKNIEYGAIPCIVKLPDEDKAGSWHCFYY
jgi:hypothetical protein